MIIQPALFALLAIFSPVLALGNGFVLARLIGRRRAGMPDTEWDFSTYTSIISIIRARRDGARFEAINAAKRWESVRAGTAATVCAELDELLADLDSEWKEAMAISRKDEMTNDGSEGSSEAPG